MTNQKIVNLAKSFIGKVSYVFGANNVEGGQADCSSFTQYIFSENGIDIGRTTGDQRASGGQRIKNIEDLKAGDLVFFQGTYDSGYKDNCSHVGIYIGNNEFVHCSSGASNVVISNITDDYYVKHWLDGLRKNGVYYVSNDDTETGTEVDLDFVGNIVKYVVVVGLIIVGVVSLIFSLGIHKAIIKGALS